MPIVAPLAGLGVLALVLWAIAFALAAAILMAYIAGALRGLPWPIDKLAGPVESLAQVITNACGRLEHGIDKLIGAAWHMLARYMDKLWHHIEESATFQLRMAETALGLTHAHIRLKANVHKAVGAVAHVVPRVKRLEREWHGIEHRVKSLERDWTKGIGHDLRIHVRALEQQLDWVRHKDIPRIRSIARGAARDVSSLRKWVEDHALVAGTAAFAGATAWALSRLGLGWLRCSSNPFNNNKRACGLWGDLAGLLAAAGIFGAALDFRDIVKAAVELEKEGAEALGALASLDSAAVADAAQAVADAANAIAT